MSLSNSSPNLPLRQLREVRPVLLRLHKALLDSERLVYEQVYGPIQSKGEFFQLVVEHEWFSWLRSISQFIVQIDEMLSSKDAVPSEDAEVLLDKARSLFRPSNQGTDLEQRYYHAIQRDPNIALMHAELSELLDSE